MNEVKYEDAPEGSAPKAELGFGDQKMIITLGFEGDWLSMMAKGRSEVEAMGLTEEDARNGFAAEFFQRVSQLF